MHQLTAILALSLAAPLLGGESTTWKPTAILPAKEANQAAAADDRFVYAIDNTLVAKYDRKSGERLAVSAGPAKHLNSGFLWNGRLFYSHSNYPRTPELSEIKVLDLKTMELSTYKDFDNYGGSLTWAIRRDDHWWCNFAHYGDDNAKTFLVKFDDGWKEMGRWTYPVEVIRQLGKYSLSGGIWRDDSLLVTGHDDPVLFEVRLSKVGSVLEYVGTHKAPFTGQGIAVDPVTGGLVGINRSKRQVIFAAVDDAQANSVFSGQPIKRAGGPRLKISLNAYSFNKMLTDHLKGTGKGMSRFELLDFCAEQNFDAIDPTGYYFPGYPKPPSDAFLNEFKRRAFVRGLDISAHPDGHTWEEVAKRMVADLKKCVEHGKNSHSAAGHTRDEGTLTGSSPNRAPHALSPRTITNSDRAA